MAMATGMPLMAIRATRAMAMAVRLAMRLAMHLMDMELQASAAHFYPIPWC